MALYDPITDKFKYVLTVFGVLFACFLIINITVPQYANLVNKVIKDFFNVIVLNVINFFLIGIGQVTNFKFLFLIFSIAYFIGCVVKIMYMKLLK